MSQTASSGRRRFNRVVCAGVAATMAFAGLTAVSSPPAAAEVLLKETFKNGSTKAGDWIAPSPKGTHSPCLTAAAVQPPAGSLNWCNAVRDKKVAADPDGTGAFQITDNSLNDAGGLILNRDLDAKKGLHIEFDQFQYKTTTAKGADGISFFLIDGAAGVSTVGDSGGWLGYRNLKGAFAGVGFDEYGNFSDKKYWGTAEQPDKGPGNRPNSVVVRGSASTNYQYVTGKQLDPVAQPLAMDKETTRDKARRTVNIDVSTAGFMNVYVDFYDGKGKVKLLSDVNLNKIEGQTELPPKIQLGFAASTGASTNYHEIQNFSVSTLDPDLTTTVTPAGPFQKGGTGTVNIDVANKPGDGPTNGLITTTFTAPDGTTVKSASGDGWTCTTEGQKVTCTRPGTDPNALQPGDKAPTIKVDLNIPADAPDKVTIQATTTVPNEHKPADNTSPPVEVPIKAAAPDITVVTNPDGPFQAGGTGSTTTTVTNDKTAGPTSGPTTAVITAPEGTTIASSAGDGWTCKVADDKKTATCTTDKVIKPGESAPPIKTVYNVPADTKSPITVPPTKVETPGETNTGNNTSPTKPVDVKPGVPDISVVTNPDGPFQAGGTGSTTTTVSNDKNAGPTTGPTTAVITAPEGTTIASSAGDGWTCKVADDKKTATCTTDKVIKPGESAPPIKTVYNVPSTTTGPVTVPPTKVTTPGETNTGNNTSPTKPVDVKPAAPDISVVTNPDGPFQAGGTGTTTTTVTNDKNAGPTNGPTTAVITAPEGTTIASSSGDGWTCKVADDKKTATCTTDKVIKPGESAAPIKTTYNVPATTTGPITVPPTKVTTPGETNTGNNTSPTKPVDVKPAAPNLAIAIDGTGNFVPGGTGTLTATVSNNKNAGPTTDKVTVTIPIPDGLKPISGEGDGWDCVEADEGVVCTRPGTGADALKPGASYPPIVVKTVGKPDLKAPVTVTAKVDTKGDTDLSDNTAKPVTLPKPGVQVGMTITPNPYEAGKKLTYTITVTNTGPNAANADLTAAVAQVWKDVPWKCTASAGSKCPASAGKGNINAAITIAAGGSVVFTADCLLPVGVKVPLTGSATVTATGDANCAKGCTVTATSKPGGTTPPVVDPSSPLEKLLQAKIDFINKVLNGGTAPDLSDLDQLIHDKLAALTSAGGPVGAILQTKIALLKKVLEAKQALGLTFAEKLIQAKIALLEKLV